MKRSIAIDGPNGAGKSTIARSVAARLGFAYVDTGALYRAGGLLALEHGIDLEKLPEIEAFLAEVTISVKYENSRQITYANDRDVTCEIRTQAAAQAASKVARAAGLRTKIVELSRQIAAGQSVVMDGRDIGSVVLPDADLKIYLDASLEKRTHRRLEELLKSGQAATYEHVLEEIKERDHRDKTRTYSPLKVAEGAIVIDSSNMSIDEVCDKIIFELEQTAKEAS